MLYESGEPGFALAQGRQRGHRGEGRQKAAGGNGTSNPRKIHAPEPPSPGASAEFTLAPWL